MTHTNDLRRLLELTLLGDREAAKVLKTYAERRADIVLALAADVTLRMVPWEQVWPLLLKVRADEIPPEIFAHIRVKLLGHRSLPNHQEMLKSLDTHKHSATFQLITNIWWSSSWTPEAWETIRTMQLASLECASFWCIPAWFKVESLDLDQVPWLGGLRELTLHAVVYREDSAHAVPPPAFDPLVKRLAQQPMPALRFLEFTGGSFIPGTIKTLCAAPWAAKLQRLVLNYNKLSDTCLEALASTPFPELRNLRLAQTNILPTILAQFAHAPFFTKLQHLQISTDEMNIIQAATLIPESAWEVRLVLLSNCNHMLLGVRHRHMIVQSRAVMVLGKEFRPYLAQLEATTRARNEQPLVAKGVDRALICVLLSLQEDQPLNVHEQEMMCALTVACAKSQNLLPDNFSLILSHISDTTLLARLCAQFLAHKSIQHFVRNSNIMSTDFVRDDQTSALKQQVILTLLAAIKPRSQDIAIQYLTGLQSTAPNEIDALKPWLCAALTDPNNPGPGAQIFPTVAWPSTQCVDGLFQAAWLLVRDDPAQAKAILKGALLIAHANGFKNIIHLRQTALEQPTIIESVLAELSPDMRSAIMLQFVQKDRRLLTQFLEQSTIMRALCPPWNIDWPSPPRKRDRTRWNALAVANALATLQAKGEAARPQLTALLTHENKHLRDLARQCIDVLNHKIKSALKNAETTPNPT